MWPQSTAKGSCSGNVMAALPPVRWLACVVVMSTQLRTCAAKGRVLACPRQLVNAVCGARSPSGWLLAVPSPQTIFNMLPTMRSSPTKPAGKEARTLSSHSVGRQHASSKLLTTAFARNGSEASDRALPSPLASTVAESFELEAPVQPRSAAASESQESIEVSGPQ